MVTCVCGKHDGENELLTCNRCRKQKYCSKDCQKKHWNTHKWTCSDSVEIKDTGTKGKGLFSKKEYTVGDIILKEKPFFKITGFSTLISTFNTLSSLQDYKQDLFWTFTNNTLGEDQMVGIWKTNSIPIGDGYAGMFAFISRANHSCDANARYVWREDKKKEFLIAQKDIEPGDEITVEYADMLMRREDRQKFLLERHNFRCTCNLCSNDLYTQCYDLDLARIHENFEEIPRVAATNPKLALLKAENRLKLIKTVGLAKPVNMTSATYDAYQMACACQEKAKADEYLRECHRLSELSEGFNCPTARKYSGMIECIQRFENMYHNKEEINFRSNPLLSMLSNKK